MTDVSLLFPFYTAQPLLKNRSNQISTSVKPCFNKLDIPLYLVILVFFKIYVFSLIMLGKAYKPYMDTSWLQNQSS